MLWPFFAVNFPFSAGIQIRWNGNKVSSLFFFDFGHNNNESWFLGDDLLLATIICLPLTILTGYFVHSFLSSSHTNVTFFSETGNELFGILGCTKQLWSFVSTINIHINFYNLIISFFPTPAFGSWPIPILALVIPLALISELRSLWQYLQHHWKDSKKAIRYVVFLIVSFFSVYLAWMLIKNFCLVLQTSMNKNILLPFQSICFTVDIIYSIYVCWSVMLNNIGFILIKAILFF